MGGPLVLVIRTTQPHGRSLLMALRKLNRDLTRWSALRVRTAVMRGFATPTFDRRIERGGKASLPVAAGSAHHSDWPDSAEPIARPGSCAPGSIGRIRKFTSV